MPFKSEKQRKFLWVRYPHIARKWANEQKITTPKRRRKIRYEKKKHK